MASTSDLSEMSLRKFDGSNVNFWKEQMQDYLIVKGQIDPIETENPPKEYKLNEWQKLDRIVRATIQMHLSESVYFTVQEDTLRNLREEGRGHKYILDLLPL